MAKIKMLDDYYSRYRNIQDNFSPKISNPKFGRFKLQSGYKLRHFNDYFKPFNYVLK